MDKFIYLRQLINLVNNTKCPICGRYKLKYKEQILKEEVLYSKYLLVPRPQNYIQCENEDCWRQFNFIATLENEFITNLELKDPYE